ncbi:universal stress protein [Patiriisocius marinus]|uniref:Universal stress protein UspA n=1 Tax=Patiriisocius marinus TaxID=1397112 RepID=A0A5J4IZT8_9FLAO|nr:universal stress protein [Patiriisocius marinus]GER60052.1 universal stress protein UspA [Patiriisocius marinus]
MKKKILIPTDFSKNSWNSLRYSSELYKNEEVEFYLVHAFMVRNFSLDSFMVAEPGEKYFEEAKAFAENELEKLLDRLQILNIPNNHKYFTKAVYNSPILAVINYVETKDIDLVIVSNKGETNAIDEVLGGNTIDFMEKVRNCPVLVIPAETSFKEPNEIVFPTSYKTHYKRRELMHLNEIARITNAPIRILHVNNEEKLSAEQEEKKLLLEECFEGLTFTSHYLENADVKTGLNIFTQSRNSEMIAFINKKHTFFDAIFSKPMVIDLGQNAKVPVLALHDFRN